MATKQPLNNRANLVAVVVGAICITSASAIAVSIGRTVHPNPVSISTVQGLTQASGLTFPERTTILDAGHVNESGSWYPLVYCYAVVRMPRSSIAGFLHKQPESVEVAMRQPGNALSAKQDMIDVQKSLGFECSEWRVADVQTFEAAYINGVSGNIFIDLDDPTSARVYISEGN